MDKARYQEVKRLAKGKLRYAYREYRTEVRKAKLLYRQYTIKCKLEDMGVVHKQIPVAIIDTPAMRVDVRVEKGA